MGPAVFVDKDGTLVIDEPFDVDPSKLRLMPGAADALRAFAAAGYRLFVVSNQPGLALGRFAMQDLRRYLERLQCVLAGERVFPTAYYCCPHHPEGVVLPWRRRCDCRKPAAGLLLQAAREHHIDLARSWMIGDILDDVEAGHRAGCRSILLDVGNESEWRRGPQRQPDHVGRDFSDVTRWLLSESRLG